MRKSSGNRHLQILGRVAAAFVKIWSASLKIRKIGCENLRHARSGKRPILYVCWHGSQLVPLSCFRNRGIVIMTSLSRDGEIQTQSMKSLGYGTIRGSSSRGGAKALLSLVKEMKDGKNTSITVDGSRGPYHVAKPGAVLLAQKTGAFILPIGMAYQACYRLSNWDKFEIPLPFSRVCMAVGAPFTCDRDSSLQEGATRIETGIIECERIARNGLN